MQTHELHNPAMTLYSNRVSVTPLNIRAPLVASVHNRELAYQTMIAGQAILTGNDDGADTDIPKAQRYKVEVNGKGDGFTYEELPFAYAAAAYHTGDEVSVSAV